MHYHLHLMTGFTRQGLERYLQSHVNDDFVIGENLQDDTAHQRQLVVLAFSSVKDRDHVRSLLAVRGHRLAPRSIRAEHVNAVA